MKWVNQDKVTQLDNLNLRNKRNKVNIALFQPAYPFGKSQTYLPGGLMNLGSRLILAGLQTSFTDLNLEMLSSPQVSKRLNAADFIGFSVLGAPYIPVVVDNIHQLRSMGYNQPILVGGEGVSRLTALDFGSWFPEGSIQISSAESLHQVLGLPAGTIPAMEDASMVPMLGRLDPNQVKGYITQEFCLYLSQGCALGCNFCAALNLTPEKYRSITSLSEEVEYICQKLAEYGHGKLTAYLSNLDTLQTPDQLVESLTLIKSIADCYSIELDLRGLATSRFTKQAVDKDSHLLRNLYSLGLRMLAFGADGANIDIWKIQHKSHNRLEDIEEVVCATIAAGIKPELLMVIGFPGERVKHVINNIAFSIRYARRGVDIRPYLAKDYTPSGFWPGQDDQAKPDDRRVTELRRDVTALTHLDYAMLASRHSHTNFYDQIRSNIGYLFILVACHLIGRCPNFPLAVSPQKGLRGKIAGLINRLMPFDR